MFEVAYRGASLDALIGAHAEPLPENDRALFRELSYGALRWFWRCKGVVDQLVERPLRRRDHIAEAVMIVGIYQLDQMRLPPHAAIHTTVQACAELERPGLKGLVNGVLRSFQRRRDALLAALPEHAFDAHPEWLWRAIVERWPGRWREIVDADNGRPPMALRVNQRRTTRADYLEAIRTAGIEAEAPDDAPCAVVLPKPVAVERLPGFERGWVSVQDVSAQMLAALVSPEPGQRVLDACAAPGGKLTHLLEAFPGVEAQAIDSDPERVRRITENLERLGLEARVLVADAADTRAWWDGRGFDLVVLDVPCTGTGVIRRHPDIKVLRRPSDVERFASVQARLLDGLWHTVVPGGRLVYVTCSILDRENQGQVEAFIRRTPGCAEEPVRLPVGEAPGCGWQILPRVGGGDGFYYAVIRKD